MALFPKPNAQNRYLVDYVNLLRRSYTHWTGRELIDPQGYSDRDLAQQIFEAPFVVVAQNAAPDPVYNYVNQRAMELFAMTWAELTSMPSRLSAGRPHREEREQLLAEVQQKGFVEGYSGIRIAKTQQEFRIENVLIWNLLDDAGQYCGQAATFSRWVFL
ncbi:MAG: MEKHLA domain-containing protein [Prochlorothrix sp.]